MNYQNYSVRKLNTGVEENIVTKETVLKSAVTKARKYVPDKKY